MVRVRAYVLSFFFAHWKDLSSSGRGSFLALSVAGHAGNPRSFYSASLGPNRASWSVLWAFIVARSWLFSRGRSPPSQSQPERWKPTEKKSERNNQQVFACFCCEYDSSHLRGSHVTTAASLQAFPFVAATNDAFACVRACLSVSHRTYRMVYHKTL